jgi:hypothetical protein
MIYDISPLESQPRHWGVELYDMAGAIFPMRKPSLSKSSSHNYSGWIMVTPRMSTRLDMPSQTTKSTCGDSSGEDLLIYMP